jgi:hypothetical protein
MNLIADAQFSGTYAVLSGVFLLHVIVVSLVRLPPPSTVLGETEHARPLRKIVAS